MLKKNQSVGSPLNRKNNEKYDVFMKENQMKFGPCYKPDQGELRHDYVHKLKCHWKLHTQQQDF
jgi:hypothetical protein